MKRGILSSLHIYDSTWYRNHLATSWDNSIPGMFVHPHEKSGNIKCIQRCQYGYTISPIFNTLLFATYRCIEDEMEDFNYKLWHIFNFSWYISDPGAVFSLTAIELFFISYIKRDLSHSRHLPGTGTLKWKAAIIKVIYTLVCRLNNFQWEGSLSNIHPLST